MRIIQVNSFFNGGGVDSQTLEMCIGLGEQGHQVLLAIPSKASWAAQAQAVPGLRVEFIDGGKLHWGIRLHRLAEQFDAQILHAHHGRDYWTTAAAAQIANNQPSTVLTRHLMTHLSGTSARFLLRLAHVTAVSQAVYEQLSHQLSGDLRKLHMIYSGVDTQRFRPDAHLRAEGRKEHGWDESHVVFAVIGNAHLPDGKGQRDFVEAGARLIAEQPQVRLLVVGHGDLIPVLQQRVAELGLQHAITFTGFSHAVERIAPMIDVLVHPAVGTEALGLVIWEAMAAARPVIASRLGGIPETFLEPQHGRLVAPRDREALYQAMKLYALDGELRRRSGNAAREFILERHYTRSGQASRFGSLYESIRQR